jgi:putative two-component system response regulator
MLDSILLKPGRLSEEGGGWSVSILGSGGRICASLKSFRFVRPIILHHHERFDGSGYPDGLLGDSIVVAATALADGRCL